MEATYKNLYFIFLYLLKYRHPPITWAQRKDRVFLTIQLRDIKNEKIELKEKSFNFSGESDKKLFSCNLNLFSEVSTEVLFKKK